MSDIGTIVELEPSPYAGWSSAQIYVDMAKAVIDVEFVGSTLTRWDLRTWWRDEAEHRLEYALSPAQEEDLKNLCRAVAENLKEGSKNPDEWPKGDKTPNRNKKPARRAAV